MGPVVDWNTEMDELTPDSFRDGPSPVAPAWPLAASDVNAVPTAELPTDNLRLNEPTDEVQFAPAPHAPPNAAPQRQGYGKAVFVAAVVSALVGGGVGAGSALLLSDDGDNRVTVTQEPALSNRVSQRAAPALGPRADIHELIAAVEPAVVAVNVRVSQSGPFGSESGEGAGTGFVISADGVIVTNNHVVENAEEVSVTFLDGEEREAEILGTDRFNDLAVIKVEGDDLPVLNLGQSADMRVGDDVVAIGNALGLDGGLSVTRGIVSGLDRTLQTDTDVRLTGLIQTDASINPGNSGGPLVNAGGEVIGINTAIASPDQTQNVGFAISIDAAKRIIEGLRDGEISEPGYLGVRTRATAAADGAVVATVEEGSPAEDAGLEPGDVIVEVDGTEVLSFADVVGLVKAKRPGDEIDIVVERDGDRLELTATLARQPAT